jgi:hypothetical protein
MTRYRVLFSGLTILAVALSAALDVNAQKATGRARMLNSSGVMAQCDSYTLSADSLGSLEISCAGTAGTPTEKGVVVFETPIRFTVNKAQSASSVNIPITLLRAPTASGQVPGLLTASVTLKVMSGPCTPYGVDIPITLAVNEVRKTLPANTIVGTGAGTCGIAMLGGDTDPNPKSPATSLFPTVAIVADPSPGPSPGGTCVNTAGQSIPEPANMYTHSICIGGTNNYAFDSSANYNACTDGAKPGASSPANSVQVFPIPQTWPSNSNVQDPVGDAGIYFTSTTGVNEATYEVTLSKCKGDFQYPDTAQASYTPPGSNAVYKPCRVVWGSDMQIFLSHDAADFTHCKVTPGEQWYMNWRVVPGTCAVGTGFTCGQTFYVPRG